MKINSKELITSTIATIQFDLTMLMDKIETSNKQNVIQDYNNIIRSLSILTKTVNKTATATDITLEGIDE